MKANGLSVGRFPSSAFANNVAVAPHCSGYACCSTLGMPIKPNGALCAIKEQIVEDLVSGLILQFECQNGRTRLVIAGSALPFGNREIIFDSEGREAAAGTLVGEFRRPSWLRKVT